MNNSGNTHPTTSPELWDKLRQIRWEWLTDLPIAVSDVMLEAADFVEAAMSQPQSPSTDLVLNAIEDIRFGMEFAYEQGLHEFGYDPVKTIEAALKSKEQPNNG